MKGLKAFLVWWLGELAGMLPRAVRERLGGRVVTMEVEQVGEVTTIARRSNGESHVLGEIPVPSSPGAVQCRNTENGPTDDVVKSVMSPGGVTSPCPASTT